MMPKFKLLLDFQAAALLALCVQAGKKIMFLIFSATFALTYFLQLEITKEAKNTARPYSHGLVTIRAKYREPCKRLSEKCESGDLVTKDANFPDTVLHERHINSTSLFKVLRWT